MAGNDRRDGSDIYDDFLYQPGVEPPKRVQEYAEEKIEEAGMSVPEMVDFIEDVPDPLLAMYQRFDYLESIGEALLIRSRFLLEKSIDDIDGYIGEIPPYLLEYTTDLTGIIFPEDTSAPEYTLDDDTKQCIFRIAGYFDPTKDQDRIREAAENFDADALQDEVKSTIANMSYFNLMMYGVRLLILVLKMSYVITVHYTIGYLCGWFKGKFKIPVAKYSLGDKISKGLRSAENALLKLAGYRCATSKQGDFECGGGIVEAHDLERKSRFKSIRCCTTSPIFFNPNTYAGMKLELAHCFKHWMRMELDPNGTGSGTICAKENLDSDRNPTAEEVEKAKLIADYLMHNDSKYGINGKDNVKPLSHAIQSATGAINMSQQVKSSVNSARDYQYNNFRDGKSSPFDCFGYKLSADATAENRIINAVNEQAGSWMSLPTDDPFVANTGVFFMDYLQKMDGGITWLLNLADRVTIGTANLAKWGSSQQLCCWVYLMVFLASMVHRFISTGGQFCNDDMVECYTCNGTGEVNGATCPTCMGTGEVQDSQKFARDLREEMYGRWASDIKGSADVQMLVELLTVIKQIVDVFNGSMSRNTFLAGLKLPTQEMWEMIKLTLANGLSEFLDILFSPLDIMLSSIKGIPEIRMMMANDCFGIGEVFDFLSCQLGNLKWSMVNYVMQFIDFTISDVTIINDIYLSRTRLASLEALSKLLESMIDLILGLKDCYEPKALVDEIVQTQVNSQYNTYRDLHELMGAGGLAQLDEASESLLGNEFPLSADEIDEVDNMPASLSSGFGDLKGIAEKIVTNGLFGEETVAMSKYMDDAGNPLPYGEFVMKLEEDTGVQVTEIRESMLHIFDILQGRG